MMMNDEFFREIESNCWDPKTRIEECNHQNVDVQVLSTVPVMFSYWTKAAHGLEISKFLNDDIAGVVDNHPKKFVGLGNLPMQDTDMAIKELERCKSIGMKGIQIGSHINELNLDHPSFFPIFEACQDLEMSIFVHPWWWMAKEKMEKYWLPWLVGMPMETSLAICSMIFSGVFERLPNLKVAFAHGGGSFPATIGRIEHGFNVRPDLVAIDNKKNPKDYLGQFWLDSLVHDPKILEYIIELVGEDKIALGTDYPFPLGELEPGKLINESAYTTNVKEKLLSNNALDWLGMKKSDFIK
jgi:aminocarboxymuconate-semialdehyde decarboxylase